MREVVCSHCGAVFVSESGVAVCPHCGRNPGKSRWKGFSLVVSEPFAIVLWLICVGVWIPGEGKDWQAFAVYAALVGATGAAIWWFRRPVRRGAGAVVTLNLSERSESIKLSAMQRLPIPEKWELLISLPRPREVPSRFWSKLIPDAAFVIWSLGFLVVRGHHVPAAGWTTVSPKDVVLFAGTAISDFFVVVGMCREIGNRHLLRDGEAALGTIVEWADFRGFPLVAYRFWTRAGEQFEHRGTVRSVEPEYSEMGPVPVFYLPEDPTKSLALCCTALRLRIPDDHLPARVQRLA